MTETATKNRYSFDDKNHIHILDGRPLNGTTTVIREVLPAPLVWYGSGQACKTMGWYDRKKGRVNFLPEVDGLPILTGVFDKVKKMTVWEYLDFLDKAYSAHDDYKNKRSGEGKETHAIVEWAIKEAIKNNDGFLQSEKYEDAQIERFAVWGRRKKFLFSEAHVYSEKLWLGGALDFVYADNGFYIGDLKTSKSIYESQFIQTGMYDAQQLENGFFTSFGERIGNPLEIKGYTIVNLPPKGDVKTLVFYDTATLRNFAKNITDMHTMLRSIKAFLEARN